MRVSTGAGSLYLDPAEAVLLVEVAAAVLGPEVAADMLGRLKAVLRGDVAAGRADADADDA